MSENLLKETIDFIEENGKKEKDVAWVGFKNKWCSWDDFKLVSDFNYDNSFGAQEINPDLFVVGSDWWLERHEYDGSEWWEFKRMPDNPSINTKLNLEELHRNDGWWDWEDED